MQNINQITNIFSKDFDVNKLLENIVVILIDDAKNVCSHIRIVSKDRYKVVGSFGNFGWIHELVPKERRKDEPGSSSVLAAKVGIPIAIDIKKDRNKSYEEIIENCTEKFKSKPNKKLKNIDLGKNLNKDFSESFDKAIENRTNYLYILPIVFEGKCLAIIHLFSEKEISNEKIPLVNELRKDLTLPLASFIRHYEREDELLRFSCELNENLLKKGISADDFIEFIINRTAEFFNVDECALSLIYKNKDPEDKKYKKYIQLVGSKNIREEKIEERIKECKKEESKKLEERFKNLGLPAPKNLNNGQMKNLLEDVLNNAKIATLLAEDKSIILKKAGSDRKKRYGLRRLCAITKEIVVYYPEIPTKQKRKIDFYSTLTGEFISKDDVEQRKELKEAKKRVDEYKQWKRYKKHLVFFENSDCKSYNIVHAPLLIREGKKEEVIGILTMENKLNNEGKVEIQTFSDYEIETFKRWINIISYCIENKKYKDLLEEIIDSSPEGIIFSDISGKIIRMSPRAKRILKKEKKNVRKIYYNKENLRKVSLGLKKATEKAKEQGEEKVGVDGYFTALKNPKDNIKPLFVEGSVYNVPNFIPDILPRAGTVGYFKLEKQEAIAKIIIEELFYTLCKRWRDPEEAIFHIIKEVPRILEAKRCVLFTSHKISFSDEKEKDFIEKEHSRITNKYTIKFINSTDFKKTEESEKFDLKEELKKSGSYKVLKYKRASGLKRLKRLKRLKIKDSPKYLVIPESAEDTSFEKEGLTAYAARTSKIIRLGMEEEEHPSKDGTKTGKCESVLIIPIIEPTKDQKEIIGVLKIQDKDGRAFTEIDETIGEIIAKALSFLIVGGASLYSRECGVKILELILDDPENTWDKKIYKKIKKFRSEVLKFSLTENEREHIYNSVKELFKELCTLLEIPESLKALSEKFLKEERSLYGLPGYREHFLHQFHDFLTGYHIITLLKPEKMVFLMNLNRLGIKKKLEGDEDFINFVKDIFQKDNRGYNKLCKELKKFDIEKDLLLQLENKDLKQEKRDLLKLWFLATMFHDIAYYIEKMKVWLDDYTKEVLGKPASYHISWASFIQDPDLDKYIRDYAGMLSQDREKCRKIELLFRDKILDHQDHGIISSLLYLKRCSQKNLDKDNIYKEAALAMALHNFPVWKEDSLPLILGKYLFDISIELKGELEQFIEPSKISEKLKNEFKKNGSLLSENAECRQIIEGRWGIINGQEGYVIIEEKNKLSVHLTEKLNFFNYPIEYLLMYCDFIQEWGREIHRGIRLNRKVKLEHLGWVEGQIVCTLSYPEEPRPIDSKDETSFDKRIEKYLKDMYASWDCKGTEKLLFKIIYDINIETPTRRVKMEIYSLDK